MNNLSQSNNTRDKSAREDGFPSQKIEWSDELLQEVYEKWYEKYKDDGGNFYLFSEYFKGNKKNYSLTFKASHSDSNLIRIGCLLGLNREQQNKVFKAYRQRYKRYTNLNSSNVPKNFFAKEEDGKIYYDLLKVLENNNIFYINPFLSQKERKETIESIKNNYQSEIYSKKYEIDKLKKEIEDYEKRIAILSEMETSVVN